MGFTHVQLGLPTPLVSVRWWIVSVLHDAVPCAAVASAVFCDRWRYCFSFVDQNVLWFFFVHLFWETKLTLFFFPIHVTHCALQSSDEKYVKNVYQWMIPFLHRCENQSPGLANSLFKEYLVTLAKEDLTLPLKIFQSSKPAVSIESWWLYWFLGKFLYWRGELKTRISTFSRGDRSSLCSFSSFWTQHLLRFRKQ